MKTNKNDGVTLFSLPLKAIDLNPTGIAPLGPEIDFHQTHDRNKFS